MTRLFRNIAVATAILLLLTSCSKSPKITATSYSPKQIAEAIISAQDNISALEQILPDDDYYSEYLADIYQLNTIKIKDGAIYVASGMQAYEIAIFILYDSS
ncbi:MAG: hypothetical protein LBH28_10955, partial [Oscillospiraceae bacterium]|nr:hypothetical protein [Oscillospiraceae bacterium]